MQQIPFIDLFIDLFKSALHVSGDKFSHPQEHFLTVYTVLVQSTDIAADRWQDQCTKSYIYTYSQNCSWGWASLSPETCRADLKRSINRICCVLLVAYVVVLMTYGLTNIKFKNDLTDISTGDLQKDILVWFMLTQWNEMKWNEKHLCNIAVSNMHRTAGTASQQNNGLNHEVWHPRCVFFVCLFFYNNCVGVCMFVWHN